MDTKKRPLKKLLRRIKELIYKLCGRARWLLLIATILLAAIFVCDGNFSISARLNGPTDDLAQSLTETPLTAVEDFSVNSRGTAIVSCDIGLNGLAARFSIDTSEQYLAVSNVLSADIVKDDFFVPHNFALTDTDELYAVRKYYEDQLSSRIIAKETVLCISPDHRHFKEVCDIVYGDKDGLRTSKLSRLHYHDGKVTFAVIDRDKVTLWSIDADTCTVDRSREYPTDEDGTYTADVIPIDGAFLFVRSDGNVYRTVYDEPMGESIYRFESRDDGIFTQAVVSGDDIYVFDENSPDRVYRLADGALTEVSGITDMIGSEDRIIDIASYRSPDTGKDVLAVCLSDRLLTYHDGTVTDRSPIIRPKLSFFRHIKLIGNIILDLVIIGLIINLFIRKKTLLYKQMLLTVPVFTIMGIVIGMRAYDAFIERSYRHTEDELEIVCELGT
ncbi:MAG: hypothetical protein IKR73_05875, partial [Oscillospiraceae bacterium]|nr:hypothetical protein [Oscillospiraceae bacterium]